MQGKKHTREDMYTAVHGAAAPMQQTQRRGAQGPRARPCTRRARSCPGSAGHAPAARVQDRQSLPQEGGVAPTRLKRAAQQPCWVALLSHKSHVDRGLTRWDTCCSGTYAEAS